MPRSSRLELHATDSRVLGPLDSASLTSEPPDIRNWFPSYVYESPELNTSNGFQDFGGYGETCLEEEKKRSGENQLVGKFDDGLLAAGKESSDGIAKCNESDEFEYSKSAALVTGLSESVSFPSEPPDIKNWFSSYFYESPLLDTIHDFAIFDYKEREDGKSCNAQKSCTQDNKDVMDFIDVDDSTELPSQSRISDVVVKCTNLVKDTKVDYQSVCKEGHNDLKPMPSILSQLTSEKVSKQMLPGQIAGNSNPSSVKKFGNTNTYGKGRVTLLNCSLINRTSPKLSNKENNTGGQDGKSVRKSIGREDCVNDSLGKEGVHEIVSPGTLDLAVPKGDSWRRPADRRSIEKENKETEFLENGFISTRKKSSQAKSINVTRRLQVQFESLGNGVSSEFNHEMDASRSRKVLSEISNFHSPNEIESTGKWFCPQKNKPDLGPPLKQLRLERWVRPL